MRHFDRDLTGVVEGDKVILCSRKVKDKLSYTIQEVVRTTKTQIHLGNVDRIIRYRRADGTPMDTGFWTSKSSILPLTDNNAEVVAEFKKEQARKAQIADLKAELLERFEDYITKGIYKDTDDSVVVLERLATLAYRNKWDDIEVDI